MFALRPRIEAADTVLNTILDATVVAGLEVQEIKFLKAAPVATVQRIVINEVQRGGDRLLTFVRNDHDGAFT